MRTLVTGGCGFIGSNFVRQQRERHPEDSIVVLDALTYAGNLANLRGVTGVVVERGDVADAQRVAEIFEAHRPEAVVHLAAESHVDRSIDDPSAFIRTNVQGTQVLLDAARRTKVDRFVQVSTDEVYGDLPSGSADERALLRPSSPYAASKAAADLLALACARTHGLPVIITRSTNNYGPRQHPEKLIPLAILHALRGETIPLYGDGRNIRDWLHVDDHCDALDLVLHLGQAGEIYNVGTELGTSNIEVVRYIERAITKEARVRFVPDRLGHDRRYAVYAAKVARDVGWSPRYDLAAGIVGTIAWYRENEAWWAPTLAGAEHRDWIERNYAARGR